MAKKWLAIWSVFLSAVACGQGESDGPLGSAALGVGGTGWSTGGGPFCGSPGGNYNTVTVNALADTQLELAVPTTNLGTQDHCVMKGGWNRRHCLLRFDLSSVPSSTQVLGGCLWLTVLDPSGADYPGYPLLRDWHETQATWQQATGTVSWETPGAWGASDSDATNIVTIPGNRSGRGFILVSSPLIQDWVSNPGNNYGLVFGNDSSHDGASFATREDPAGGGAQLEVWTVP